MLPSYMMAVLLLAGLAACTGVATPPRALPGLAPGTRPAYKVPDKGLGFWKNLFATITGEQTPKATFDLDGG